jgi:hypothetical protein
LISLMLPSLAISTVLLNNWMLNASKCLSRSWSPPFTICVLVAWYSMSPGLYLNTYDIFILGICESNIGTRNVASEWFCVNSQMVLKKRKIQIEPRYAGATTHNLVVIEGTSSWW